MIHPITFEQKGDWSKTTKFLERAREVARISALDKYGKAGAQALREATPRDTGKTADSWNYKIVQGRDGIRIIWENSNTTENGIPIVVLIHYGHMTGTGAYVEGRDFINPALQPIFDAIARDTWKELTKNE